MGLAILTDTSSARAEALAVRVCGSALHLASTVAVGVRVAVAGDELAGLARAGGIAAVAGVEGAQVVGLGVDALDDVF